MSDFLSVNDINYQDLRPSVLQSDALILGQRIFMELDHDRVFELSLGLAPKFSRDYVVEHPTPGSSLIPLLQSPAIPSLKSFLPD